MTITHYRIHGDNIVECNRAFEYVVAALSTTIKSISGPKDSVTCPSHEITLQSGDRLIFTCLPGFGENRWNQDILGFVKSSGGRLREAADAIVTLLKDGKEKPLFAIEFCGALPAGNQAWQRQGRAFSFAHANIPYFYIAELGGFELTSSRERKAERLPNPAVPFSFFSMTHYHGSVCLPVYEANSGARAETISHYSPIFGKTDFLDYIRCALTNQSLAASIKNLGKKCTALVELLTSSKKQQSGLTDKQWKKAKDTIESGKTLTAYLTAEAPLAWSKVAYIDGLTASARAFMELGKKWGYGLTSSKLPVSFIPSEKRPGFVKDLLLLYPKLEKNVATWLASQNADLAIAWIMGFKPKGDDARPDRGLAPLARMLVGDQTHLLTFIYGPAPKSHWDKLQKAPAQLAITNGLWEAIFGVSDALLIDSVTMPANGTRGLLKQAWASILTQTPQTLNVNPTVVSTSEQDVDTALHVIFASLGYDVVFEGMCNPPGGDWSGVSFMWSKEDGQHRWLTLPRVSATGAKRPDHVFSLFGLGKNAVCLCIESKERAQSLETDIGPRLIRYTKALFDSTPSIWRQAASEIWGIYTKVWKPRQSQFLSMGAYLAKGDSPFAGVPNNTKLDILCGFVFSTDKTKCTAHVQASTEAGDKALDHIIAKSKENPFVEFKKAQ